MPSAWCVPSTCYMGHHSIMGYHSWVGYRCGSDCHSDTLLFTSNTWMNSVTLTPSANTYVTLVLCTLRVNEKKIYLWIKIYYSVSISRIIPFEVLWRPTFVWHYYYMRDLSEKFFAIYLVLTLTDGSWKIVLVVHFSASVQQTIC